MDIIRASPGGRDVDAFELLGFRIAHARTQLSPAQSLLNSRSIVYRVDRNGGHRIHLIDNETNSPPFRIWGLPSGRNLREVADNSNLEEIGGKI
jgi:hypothetical protein